MANDANYSAFLARAKEISHILREQLQTDSFFMVISHNDADGLSSASIIGSALTRSKARFTIRITEELTEEVLDEISKCRPDVAIFTDIGSGYFDLLATHLDVKSCVVLDHHQPSAEAPKKVSQLNPHEFAIDGARLVSAAGVCYFVTRELSEQNKDLSALGIVGALGDMQDKNEKRALGGLNELMVEDAVSSGNVRMESDLVLYGRETRPIHRALAYTTTPYLPNLSGREDNCLTLLSNNSIKLKEGNRFRTIADLSQDEKQKLLNAIISYFASLGIQSSVVLDMVGTVYTFLNEPQGSPTRDGREFSALLNACGRTGNPSIGIGVSLGDRTTALEEANEVVTGYRKTLATYMEWLTKSPDAIQKLKTIWVVRGENQIQDSMTGAFSSILSSAGNLSPDHAIIVLTRGREGWIKLSARAPQKLLKMGVNLGAALNTTSKKYSGFGGGHDVAAGAQIKVDDPTRFLQELDQVVLAQMKPTLGS
jgi:single-stranded-DNA-specific exonuclease